MTLIARQYTTIKTHVQHLRVKQSSFSETAKEKLRRIGSPARWHLETGEWDCPLTPASVIALDLVAKELGEAVQWLDGLQEYADGHLKASEHEHLVRMAIEEVIRKNVPLDPYVTRMTTDYGEAFAPMRHQQIAYHWSQRVRGLYLAHDPGTGKTRSASDSAGGWYRNGIIRPMAPAFLQGKHGVSGGVLVVCPKTMLKTWAEQVKLWQNATSVIIDGSSTKKARLAAQPAHFHIINYEGLINVVHSEYDSIIGDELHRCSNSTNQTEYMTSLAQKAKRILGLSGTPISNNLGSIFYQARIIDGGKALGPSREAFNEKYFNAIQAGQFKKHVPREDAAKAISEKIAAFTYFVRKEEVVDLPPKTHTPVYLDMTAEQESYYNQIRDEAVAYIQDAEVSVEQAAARMMKLLQICQGFVLADDHQGRHFTDAKTLALTDLLTNALANRKVVVWCYFNYEIERLVNMLKEKGIPFIRVDGTVTSQRVRDEGMAQWNTDPNLRVYIRQLSMSEGVTLHAKDSEIPCFDSIYLCLSYSYTAWKQSQDRIHRIGQKFPCSYTYFLTSNGVDRAVYEAVLKKDALAGTVQTITKDYYLGLLKEQSK